VKFLNSAVISSIAALASLLITGASLAQGWTDPAATPIEDLRPADLDAELSTALDALDFGLVGDTIDPATGALSFRQVDVSLPGNSRLPVEFARTYSVQGVDYFDNTYGGWNLDVPFITARTHLGPEVFFLNMDQSDYDQMTIRWLDSTCFGIFDENPPQSHDPQAVLHNNSIGSGTRLFLPGRGGELVGVTGSNPRFGSITPERTTQSYTRLDCVPYTGTGSGTHAIRAVDTSGMIYYFNRITLTQAGVVGVTTREFGEGPACDAPEAPGGCPVPGDPNQTVVERHFLANVNLFATRIEDPHGNWVEYDYTGRELTRIEANDGRVITVGYNGYPDVFEGTTYRIASVTANNRTWDYTLEAQPNSTLFGLTKVELPDEPTLGTDRFWEYDFAPLATFSLGGSDPCAGPAVYPNTTPFDVLTVQHPSGTQARFELGWSRFAKNNVPDTRYNDLPPTVPMPEDVCRDHKYAESSTNLSVQLKRLTIPGSAPSEWTYSYEQGRGWRDYPNGLPSRDLRTVTITDSEGHVTTNYFDRRYGSPTVGLMLRSEVLEGGISVVQTTDYDYVVDAPVGPFLVPKPCRSLTQVTACVNQPVPLDETNSAKVRLQDLMVLNRSGDTYTTETTFNFTASFPAFSFERPTTIERWSNVSGGQANGRTSVISYHHDEDDWIIGLPSTATHNGKLFDEYIYNSVGQLTEHHRFNELRATFTYHTTGNAKGALKTSADALAVPRVTQYLDYHRGVPRNLVGPDGKSITRTVDDNGWLTGFTDRMNNTTGFQRNSQGWLTTIDLPGAWADTNVDYFDVVTADFRVETNRGNLRSTTWYDGLYRPVSQASEDAVQPTLTSSYVNTEYDMLGRPDFKSLPDRTRVGATTGVTTTYDALGRILQTQETAAPNATTTYAYLAGNVVEMTNPEGNVTRTTRTGYAGPDDGDVLKIEQFEGSSTLLSTTEMTYNDWGNMLSARQHGSANNQSADLTQDYEYNTELELCRHTAPSQGSTGFVYDQAGQLIFQKRGNGDGCNSTPDATWTQYGYDLLGRLQTINYPDVIDNTTASPTAITDDITYTYDDNGNVLTTSRGGTVWTYTYAYTGAGDLLSTEQLTIDGKTFLTTHNYDALGNKVSVQLPSNRVIQYTPNALGQPTKAGDGTDYASGITYHANGMVDGLTLGNATLFDQDLNARQLPSKRAYSGSFDFDYTYDLNGRIEVINDINNQVSGDRTYAYDGMGRLKSAQAPQLWGEIAYVYDPVGNLMSRVFDNGTPNTSDDRNVTMMYASGGSHLASATDSDHAGGPFTYTYDHLGNVLSNGTYNFSYDAANQPVSGDNGQPTGSAVFIQHKIAVGSSEYTTAHGGAPTNGSAPNYDFNVSGQGIASVQDLNIARQDRLVPRERPVREQGVTYTLKLKMRLQGQVSTPGIYADIRFRTLNASYSGGQNHNKVYIRPADMQSPDPDGWVEFTTTYTETADPNGGHLVAVFQRSSAASGSGTIEVKEFEVTTNQAVGPTTMAYTYDGNLKRVKQVEGDETIYSVYTLDGMLVHRESKVGSDPAKVTDYVSVAGMSIARITDGTPTYLYTNHLGTPIIGANAAGAVEWMETSTPYGEAWSVSAANDNHTAYTGHIRDKSTGLSYMQARMYDPMIGRFLSTDPVQYEGFEPSYLNRYAYVGNNPINRFDPNGLDCCLEWSEDQKKQQEARKYRRSKNPDPEKIIKDSNNRLGATVATIGSIFLPGPEDGILAVAAARVVATRVAISGAQSAIRGGGRLVLYHGKKPDLEAGEFAFQRPGGLWSPRANDKVLEAAMAEGKPIRDSFVDASGNQLRPKRAGSVISQERQKLEKAGWKYNPKTREYEPPE